MDNTNVARKTWAKPNQRGPFGSDRLDLVFASEPQSPQSPPFKEQVFDDTRLSPGFKSPSMSSFLDRRFTFAHGEGEGDENSAVSSSNIVDQIDGYDQGSKPKTSPRQTWDIFIHDTPKSNTKAVRNIIQAWREKEMKSFHNLSDSGGNANSTSNQSKSSFLGDGLKSKSSLVHKRALSSSIDQLNNIFDAMQADSSESDSQDGNGPPRGSLGYFKACATPQLNRKFPHAKKTVTFVDHKSGKVTPTRRRDRSSDGGQRSKFFDTPSRGRASQPVVHPMFKAAAGVAAARESADNAPDDPDLNDSIDSGVVVQEVSKTPARKPLKALAVPLPDGTFKLHPTRKSPPPLSLDDDSDDRVDATSNPFKNVLEQWQSNQKKENLSIEVKMKNKANEEKVVCSLENEDTVAKENNNIIEIDKPEKFIYTPSQLKSQRDNMFNFNQKEQELHKNTGKGAKSNFEVSPTLLDEFPTKLVNNAVKDQVSCDVTIKAMGQPIDEDLDLHNVQVHEKISMFEVKRPPKHPSQSAQKSNRGRQLPKPPSVKVNEGCADVNTKRISLSEQFRTRTGKGRSASPSLLSSASCTDIYRECDSSQAVSTPYYETQSLSRSRPKLRANAPKSDTNRARSRTPNFPRSSGEHQTTPNKPTTAVRTRDNKSTSSPEPKSSTSPRSNSASLVASIVSKINRHKPGDKADQTNVSSANRFRSSSSSAILTAPIPFSKAKPPVYSHVSSPANSRPDEARRAAAADSPQGRSYQNGTSLSGTAASKISRSSRKIPDVPDSPASSPRSNSSGRKTPEPTATTTATSAALPATPAAGRLTPTAAKQFAGGRRTPEYFLRERHIATEKSRGVSNVDTTADVVVVSRGYSQASGTNTDSNTKNVVISGTAKRQLPSVSAAVNRRSKTPDVDAKPPLQRSSSGRAFPNSQLFERRSEVTQKRAEKQKNMAQRLGGRILPSAPSVNKIRAVSGGADRDGSQGHKSESQASHTSRNMRSPSPTSRQEMASASPSLRHRVTSPSQPRSGAASPVSSRGRDRARSPWQMMLASGRLNQPKQSMASLGRSITRCLTPNKELLGLIDNEESDTDEPYVPLLRGRSEPNLVSIFDSPMSPLSSTSSDQSSDNAKQYGGLSGRVAPNERRGSASNELESEDNEIAEAFSAKQSRRRKQVPRERRRTVGSVPTMAEIERSKSPAAPRLRGTSVSERFLRLSQGDLSAPPDTLDELMRNPPKHRGVRRSSSLRDFHNTRSNRSVWNSDVTGSKRQDGSDQSSGKPIKVFRDQNGLVGYVFNV